MKLRTAGLTAKHLNPCPSDYSAGIMCRELLKHLSCSSCSGILYSGTAVHQFGQVRLGYGSGDLLTSRKLATASESDVLCGHGAVVCPDSKSACCWHRLSDGVEHLLCVTGTKAL